MTVALAYQFPLVPSQFTLFNVMFIGIPSFVLAMEPNKNIVKGKFIINVLKNALPAGLTNFTVLVAMVMVGSRRGIPDDEISTMTLFVIAFVGLLMLYKVSRPLNTLRIALIICMLAGFIGGAFVLNSLGGLSPLTLEDILLAFLTCIVAAPVFVFISLLMGRFGKKW
jgi:cation-transporting ATPase E